MSYVRTPITLALARRNRLRAKVIAAWVLAACVLPARAGAPIPVIVFCASPDIADLTTAELSKNPDIAVIERQEVRALLAEGAKSELTGDLEKRVRLGRILGAERIISLRATGRDRWQIQIADAASGRLLGSLTADVAKEELAAKCAELLKTPIPKPAEEATRVALPDFAFEIENVSVDEKAASLKIAEQLRLHLLASGHDILDRAASAQVANEQMLSQEGWIGESEKPAPLLGAEALVAGRWTKDRSLEIAILSTASGSLAVRQVFPVPPPGRDFDFAPVLAWIQQNLPRSGAPATGKRDLLPRQMEALEPFYRGIGLYQSGNVLEATVEFQRAYTLNDKFEEAYLWEARCYDRAGLSAMAAALRSFVEIELVGRGVSSMSASTPVEGLTFLGIADQSEHPSARQRLEVLITESVSKERQRVLLPENLARLRDEYDLLLGVENSRGHSWQESPGFLMEETLSGALSEDKGGWKLRMDVNGTLSGETLASILITLPPDPSAWPAKVNAGVQQLMKDWEKSGGSSGGPMQPLPSEEKIRDGIGKTGNLAILQLALKAPDRLATDWRRLEKPSKDLPFALNLGLREHLLGKISPTHPNRPWMELERIAGFLPDRPRSREYVHADVDPVRELEAFVRRHPDDVPGIVAEYMLLWETMAKIPPAQVEQRFAALVRRIGELNEKPAIQDWQKFSTMPNQLRLLAAAAQGKAGSLPPSPGFGNFPKRMVPRVGDRSDISLVSRSPWVVDEWLSLKPTSPQTEIQEAKAVLALSGRGNNRFVVDPAWLKEFPDSVGLSSFVIRAIRMANKSDGLPLRAPLDAVRERALYREMVEYVFRQLRRQIGIASDARELNWLENSQLRLFFTELSQPGFQRTVPDEEMESMRQTLMKDVEAAAARLSRPVASGASNYFVNWKDVNRTRNSFEDRKTRRVDQENVYDYDFLRKQAADMLAEVKDKPLFSSTWYQRMRGKTYGTMSARTTAEYYAAAMPQVRSGYFVGDLGTYDMENLVQYGVTLLGGGYHAEAEEIFRRVAKTDENDLNRSRKAAELRANAYLNLGALAIHSGHDSEGAAHLRKAIELSGGSMVGVVDDGGWNSWNYESVQSLAVRLLSDLRENIPKNEVVNSVGQIRLTPKGYFPGKVSFYFRVPSGFDPASGRKYRVLLLMPSINQDAAEYCKADHTWARFADAHDLFLVVPEFMQFWSNAILPQEWSGEATLQALSELQKRYPITTDSLLLHGYGRGAAFLQRFALWRPQLCAAASLHSTSDWAWEESMPEGLGPLSDLRKVPLLVTSGERDGEIDNSQSGSYAATVRFVTFARGEGVPVEWKSLPGVVHRPSADMESLAQQFLARQLGAGKKAASTP